MNFWLPTAFAFLTLIPLIVLLHMLRPRRVKVIVPSLLPWTARSAEAQSKPGFGMLRHWLALLLSVAIFLLLLLALAQPDFSSWFRPRSTIVILDTRARMQAKDVDGVRAFDRAIAVAKSYASRAKSTNAVALMTLPETPSLVSFTSESRTLLDSIHQIQPTDASGDLSRAVAMAESALKSRGGAGEVVVITDRLPTDPMAENVVTFATGSAAGNTAITALDARRSAAGTTQVFLAVRNFSDAPTPIQVALRLDGNLIDAATATLQPDEKQSFSFSLADADLRKAAQGELTATLENLSDSIATDNIARAVLPVGPPPKVLLITTGNPYLEKALAADSTLDFELLSPESWQPSFLNEFPAVILDNWLPAEMTPGSELPGNVLYLGRSPWDVPDARVENPVVTDQIADSPLVQNLQLDGVRIKQASQLKIPQDSEWKTIVSSADAPLILSRQDPDAAGTRAVILSFLATDSDLPGRVAFPLLISNAVHWLMNDVLPEPMTAGEGAALNAGFVSSVSRKIAINPSANIESDVRQAVGETPKIPHQGSSAAFLTKLWQIPAVLALALIFLDWVAYHRRWIPNDGR